MYMMFADFKHELELEAHGGKKPTAKDSQKKSSISITHKGKDAYKVYQDKVNMGNPDSDMIPYIRDFMAKESKNK